MARPKSANKKKAESIYFEPELHDWLKEKAEAEERTISYLVNKIISAEKDKS